MCNKLLEIQANKKVEFLRTNDKSTRMKNSKAPNSLFTDAKFGQYHSFSRGQTVKN